MNAAQITKVNTEADCSAVESQFELEALTPEVLAMVGGGEGIISNQ